MRARTSLILAASLLILGVACAPAVPSPTAAPPKPAPTAAARATEAPKPAEKAAPKPTEAPAAKPAAKPTEAPAAKPAAKALPPDYFAGKTITLVAPYSAGGPTDLFARLLAQHLERFVPGKPTIIVQNVAGAGGTIGANQVYNSAKKDGSTLLVTRAPQQRQMMNAPGVQYDVTKMLWLGAGSETAISFAHKSLGITRPQELPKVSGKLIVGGFTPESGKDLSQRSSLDMIDVRYKYLPGFPGNADARAAMLRGEINFFEESLTGWRQAVVPLVKDGTVFPMGQRGFVKDGKVVRDPREKDIPTTLEIAEELKGPDVKKSVPYRAMEAVVKMDALAQVITYPPGVDMAVVEFMRKAIQDTFADPDFKAQAERQLNYEIQLIPGAEAQRMIGQIIEDATRDKEAMEYLAKLAKE